MPLQAFNNNLEDPCTDTSLPNKAGAWEEPPEIGKVQEFPTAWIKVAVPTSYDACGIVTG